MITIKLPKAKTRNVLHLSMIKHGVRKRTFGDSRKRRANNARRSWRCDHEVE